MKSRRNFIKKTAITSAGIAVMPSISFANNRKNNVQKLKVGVIGVGLRGTNHLNNLLKRDDVLVTAVCDIDPARIAIAEERIAKAGKKKAQIFGKNDLDYRNLLALKDVDAVVISTPWLWHTRMAVDSMKAGKYTGLEVSAANTLEECWDLVNTHEETGSHLMILENVNYRQDVLAVLNMVKQNLFGELSHFRCGYQHDLRAVKFNDGKQAYGGGVEFGEKGT
ncbi:Tat (twin-arginine translocation) pathway signal sequence, partial [Arenibacter nanhaiticus]